MADDGAKSGIGQTIAGVGESVAKPIVDELGKVLETAGQSITGSSSQPQQTPEDEQKKKLDEDKKKQWALRVIEWNKQLQTNQQKVRQEEEQKKAAQIQAEQQQKKVKQYELIEKQQKSQQVAVAQAQRKTEVRGGVGG